MRTIYLTWQRNYFKYFFNHIIKVDNKKPSFEYLKTNHSKLYTKLREFYDDEKTMFKDLGLTSLLKSDYIKKTTLQSSQSQY